MRCNRKGVFWMTAGLILIVAAIVLAGYNIWEEKQALASASQALAQLQAEIPVVQIPQVEPTVPEMPEEGAETTVLPVIRQDKEEVEIPDYILNPEMDMPVRTVDGWDYIGVLDIPALNLSLPIISQWSDTALKIAPCRYVGSAYTKDMVIAGHNYRSHFANLKNVPEGSSVYFTDMDGNCFEYEVILIETLHSTDVEEMQSGDWDLSLFTCTMSGQYRAMVRCELVSDK